MSLQLLFSFFKHVGCTNARHISCQLGKLKSKSTQLVSLNSGSPFGADLYGASARSKHAVLK